MELERLQVVIEASTSDFKKKMNVIKGIMNSTSNDMKKVTNSVDTKNIDKLNNKIKDTKGKLADLYAQMDEIQAKKHAELSEMPFNSDIDLDATMENSLGRDKGYQKLKNSVRSVEIELERYKATLAETIHLQGSNSNKTNRFAEALNRVKNKMRDVKNNARNMNLGLRKTIEQTVPLSKSIFRLSNMFKLMALRMVMRATLNAIKSGFNDLAKANTGFNSTMSILQGSFLQARNALATAFAPALQALTPIITTVTNAFINAFNTIGMFTARLFGNVSTFAKATQVSTNYAKSLGGTADAAKKAGGALAGFDEINTLGNKNGEDTGLPTAAQMFEEQTIPEDKLTFIDGIKAKINELMEPLQNISFENLINAFNGVKEAASPITQTLFSGLEWAYLNLFIPLSGFVIGTVIPMFLDGLAFVLDIISKTLDAFKPLGMWLWENFLQPIAKWTGGIIVDVLGWLNDKLKDTGEWMEDNKSVVEDIALVVGAFALAWGAVNIAIGIWNVIGAIATGVTTAFGAAVAFLTSPITLVILAIGAVIAIVVLLIKHWDDVKKAAETCWNKIKEVWSIVATWFDTNIIKPVGEFFKNLWEGIKTLASNTWDGIVNIWNAVATWFETYIIKPVTGFFKSMWDGISNAAAWCWDSIKNVFNNTVNWFDDKIMTPIKNGFKNVINFLIGMVEGFINAFVKGINVVINALNRMSFKVPDWVPGIGGQTWGFNITPIQQMSIPRLARGGIVDSPTIAMIGERGKEAVVPLENTAFVDTLASALGNAVMTAMQFNNSNNNNTSGDIILQLDGTAFARLINPYSSKETNRLGNKLILETI